jgi:hypothetical protein
MGLDMYLHKETYVGAQHEYRDVQGTINLTCKGDNDEREKIDIVFHKVVSITEHVLYWRKANHIHKWFVDNVQNGKDDCEEYHVFRSTLEELFQVCDELLRVPEGDERNNLAMKLLPPQQGFFFGTYDINEWYWNEVIKTHECLKAILDEPYNINISYKYQSSW